MNKALVFIFATPPHGTSLARESLDACLAASAVTEDVVAYFDGEGVWQLLVNQQPAGILQRNILPTYGLLELYDVEQVFVNPLALAERGLTLEQLAIPTKALASQDFWTRYGHAHAILRF
ncbi:MULTISPECIES: sulfurtransferase complex subunit TusC [unclassified Agarivorans]|uniref:sulfurtransferase complex subunit TusC n=1 Tax=unclassified Agarivorans TaxID=2636026 RepID=UPI003D7D8621